MHGIFSSYVDFVFVYLNDILVTTASESQHIEHLRCVFDLIVLNGLTIYKSKCLFGVGELEYLGHMVTSKGIRPFTSRIDATDQYPTQCRSTPTSPPPPPPK